LEINSEMSAAAQMGQQAGSGRVGGQPSAAAGASGQPSAAAATGQGMVATMDPGIVKARVAKIVKESCGKSPENAKKAMKGVFGKDYKQITPESLGERLVLITNLLRAMEKDPNKEQLIQEVLSRIQGGMDQIPLEMLDDVVVDDKGVKFWTAKGETVVDDVDENVLNVLDTVKKRSAKKKKTQTKLNPAAEFGAPQYEAMAEDFGISVQDAKDIIVLFKSCFDAQGKFVRASFEKNIPEFVRHEKSIFGILWELLKGTPDRSDRLPFLNSLQVLVKEIKNPLQVIKVLTADFIADPANVEYTDRNAIMLASQFLRTYNKEINMDIEITPEEVLLVKEGLDTSVLNYIRWKVDGEQKAFFEKIVTIRKGLLGSLDPDNFFGPRLPTRFLLGLEREVHIFLALVGGKTAHSVIQGALKVYGNPASQIYLLKESQNHVAALLQHLSVLIRGFGRLGEKKDLAVLEQIKDRQKGFLSLDMGDAARLAALVRRVVGWIDTAKNDIQARSE
jgi:hypothetical protein